MACIGLGLDRLKMKITKTQLRKIIKEEMDDELGFATGERVLEFLAAQLNVREEDAPDFLRWVANRLEGK